MKETSDWKASLEEIKVFAKWALSSLIDGLFLVIWVTLQWASKEYVYSKLPLYGIDALVLSTFQILFAFSTLAPVVIYIFLDTAKMTLRALRVFRELKNDNASERKQDAQS